VVRHTARALPPHLRTHARDLVDRVIQFGGHNVFAAFGFVHWHATWQGVSPRNSIRLATGQIDSVDCICATINMNASTEMMRCFSRRSEAITLSLAADVSSRGGFSARFVTCWTTFID